MSLQMGYLIIFILSYDCLASISFFMGWTVSMQVFMPVYNKWVFIYLPGVTCLSTHITHYLFDTPLIAHAVLDYRIAIIFMVLYHNIKDWHMLHVIQYFPKKIQTGSYRDIALIYFKINVVYPNFTRSKPI